MCTSGQLAGRPRQRRFPAALLLLSVLGAQVLFANPSAAQNFPPEEPDECAIVARTAGVLEGEVVAREVLVDQFSTNIDLISVRTESGVTQRLELDGDPGLVEVGTTYSFRTITVETPEGETVLLSSAFGDNLKCLMDEEVTDAEDDADDEDAQDAEGDDTTEEEVVELVPVENGVSLLAEDGTTTLIEKPPLIPSLPIAPRTFFIGFGIFALVIFLIRFR